MEEEEEEEDIQTFDADLFKLKFSRKSRKTTHSLLGIRT